MTCTDCGEDVKESERPGLHWCIVCRGPMHQECSLLLGGEAACEKCFTAENSRFFLVLAAGTGEGRDPVLEEGDKAYTKPLPGEALRLVDAKGNMAEGILPWDASVAELAIEKGIQWFGEEEDDE